jgi:hypothetical protein
MFASFVKTFFVCAAYAILLYLVSCGNVPNTGLFPSAPRWGPLPSNLASMPRASCTSCLVRACSSHLVRGPLLSAVLVSFGCCALALIYQTPRVLSVDVFEFINRAFAPVAPNVILDVGRSDTSTGSSEASPLQWFTYALWATIGFSYLIHILIHVTIGKKFWHFWRRGVVRILCCCPGLGKMMTNRHRNNRLPAMLVAAAIMEVMLNVVLVGIAYQVRQMMLSASDRADVHLKELKETLDANRCTCGGPRHPAPCPLPAAHRPPPSGSPTSAGDRVPLTKPRALASRSRQI